MTDRTPADAEASPAAAPASPSREPVPAPGGSRAQLLRSLGRHKLLAFVVFLFVTALGSPLAWIRGEAKYASTAVVYVSPRFVANLQDGKEIDIQSDAQYHEYIQQNARTINRFDILLEALKTLGPRNAIWVKPKETIEHAAERLQAALAITPVTDTYQIAVTLESPKRDGLADLVNAIVNIYLAKAKSEEFYASDERVKTLLDDRGRLEDDMARKQARRLEVSQELGVSSFTDNFVNPYDRLLGDAKQALGSAEKQKIEADALVATVDAGQRPAGNDALRALAAENVSKDTALTSLEANLNVRRTQLLSNISGLTADNPARRAVERELADLEKEREATYQRLLNSYSRMILDERRAEDYKATQVVEKLHAEVDRQASQASWFTRNYQEGMQLGDDIDLLRKRIDGIQQRIDFFSLEKSAPGFVRSFSAARPPDQPTKGGRRTLLAVVFFVAFLAGLAAPMMVDMADPRIHTPRDVEQLLGFPPLAWLMDKKEAGKEFAGEQTLRLANRIAQDQQSSSSRIFAFTSVKAKGGTSGIVLDTAAALSRLGVRALAVEANAYRADPRYRAPGDRGLTVVLRGNYDLASAVVPGNGEMPDYLPIGDVKNEKNLPDIQNLMQLLQESAAAYSVVLVDLPPILVSVDAEFISRQADVVVLVVEAHAVTRAELLRCAKSLERLAAPGVAVVLNRVRSKAGDGFAAAARQEFRTGISEPPVGLLGRLLWR
jgi:Mrp family chromosome partitioning ATPase/uncharacterized protein involved in exopolysaccharide biosynthesis